MKTLNLTPELFQTYEKIMAAVLEAGATEVMVAGGAVRDALLGKPIKDIDVFYSGDLFWHKLNKNFKTNYKPPKDEFGFTEAYEENDEWQVTHQSLLSEYSDKPVQFIRCKDFATHLNTFGAGLCKVALLADGTLWITPEFIRDCSEGILHFNPNCGEKFKDKMCDKYPEMDAMDEVVY